MNMRNNETTDNDKENILFETAKNTVIIVRDEQCSKRLAKQYSAQILVNNIKIITADELGECIFLSAEHNAKHLKLIAEDKRVFAFYQTILENGPKKRYTHYQPRTNDWTITLNITGCLNSVHIAGQFYALWNEINENMLDLSEIESVIGDTKQQHTTWKTFCEIYEALRTFLYDHGLTDRIFVRTKTAVDTYIGNILTLIGAYNRVVFLDCWGETPLTGYMLSMAYQLLTSSDKCSKTVEYVLTIPESIIDKEKWLLRYSEVSLERLAGDPKNKQFTFVRAASPAEVCYKAVSLIAESGDSEQTTVIDLDTSHDAFGYMLSDRFGLVRQMPYFNCRLYVWLDTMYKLLDSIVFNKSASVLLCDINTYRDAIWNDSFIGLYFTDNDEDRRLLADFRNFIDDKIKNGYIYYDIDNSILDFESRFYLSDNINQPDIAAKYSQIAQRVELLNTHINRILTLTSVAELKQFLYSDIAADDERSRFFYDEHFRVFETFFTAVEDTVSLERMGIVTHWDRVFPVRDGVPQVGINLLKILTDYLKDQKIQLSDNTNDVKTNLIWASADKYEWTSSGKLILLNMNEKIFPAVSFSENFFSEKQRNLLGLPNADDAVSRQRLLLTDLLRRYNDVAVIFIENEAKDIFGSGFLDEIKLYCRSNGIECSYADIEFNDGYNALMSNVLGHTQSLSMNEYIDDLLFAFDADKDLDHGEFRLSASRLKALLTSKTFEDKNQPRTTQNVLAKQIGKNHYTRYYINDVIGAKFFEQQRIPKICERMLGNMIHDLYRDIIYTITNEIGKERYSLNDSHFDSSHIEDVSKQIISKMYQPKRNAYLYKVPDDWTKEYLDDFIFRYAVKQLNGLLDQLRSDFGDQEVQLIPETEYGSDPASNTKSKISGRDINTRIEAYNEDKDEPLVSDIPNDTSFILDARADVCAESESLFEIIDYKTGSKDSNHDVQLLAYEKTYEDKGNISSFFFNVFETQKDSTFQYKKQNNKFPIELFDYIYQAVNPIFKLKYFVPNEDFIK